MWKTKRVEGLNQVESRMFLKSFSFWIEKEEEEEPFKLYISNRILLLLFCGFPNSFDKWKEKVFVFKIEFILLLFDQFYFDGFKNLILLGFLKNLDSLLSIEIRKHRQKFSNQSFLISWLWFFLESSRESIRFCMKTIQNQSFPKNPRRETFHKIHSSSSEI